jgi:preprotein translocase subunit SecB
MKRNNLPPYSLEKILLKSLRCTINKPFSKDTFKSTEINISLGYGIEVNKGSDNILAFTSLHLKVIDRTASKETKNEHLSIELKFFLHYINSISGIDKAKLKKQIQLIAFEDAWPYFRENIDSLLTKAGYHPFCLPPFDIKNIKTNG